MIIGESEEIVDGGDDVLVADIDLRDDLGEGGRAMLALGLLDGPDAVDVLVTLGQKVVAVNELRRVANADELLEFGQDRPELTRRSRGGGLDGGRYGARLFFVGRAVTAMRTPTVGIGVGRTDGRAAEG